MGLSKCANRNFIYVQFPLSNANLHICEQLISGGDAPHRVCVYVWWMSWRVCKETASIPDSTLCRDCQSLSVISIPWIRCVLQQGLSPSIGISQELKEEISRIPHPQILKHSDVLFKLLLVWSPLPLFIYKSIYLSYKKKNKIVLNCMIDTQGQCAFMHKLIQNILRKINIEVENLFILCLST